MIGTQISILQLEAIATPAQAWTEMRQATPFPEHYSASLYMGSPLHKDAH